MTNENDSSDEVAQIQYFDVSSDNNISNHVTNNLRVPVVEHDINNLIPLLIRSLNKVRYTIQKIKSFNWDILQQIIGNQNMIKDIKCYRIIWKDTI